jgi:NtrC-family two-component system sensor histidine kinase KinB
MTLRSKLLLAQAPTALAVIFVGVLASVSNGKLARSSELILKDNYRSVLAAQRMKEAIERVDSAALFIVAGEGAAGARQAQQYLPVFERELATQESNVTEAGEPQATGALRARWDVYQGRLRAFMPLETATESERRRAYFARLQPAFLAVKEGADVILAINQDAMVRKSDRARSMAQRLDVVMIGAALAACLVGLLSSLVLTTRLLRPLGVLRLAARRLGEGDPRARARIAGRDEISEVATEFNTMADRLALYRQSSLGELIAAQQQSQAAIDSLPDPVLIFDAERRLVAVNHAAEDSLRVTLDAEAGDALAPAPPEVRAAVDRVAAQVLAGKGAYQPRGLEEAVRTVAAGQEAFLLPRATPVLSEQGGVIGVAMLLQDVTRLMRFDELKSNLVATVAHEFRTPLTSLRMALHLCLEQAVGPITEKQADLLQAARQDTERLQQIVDDLLDLSRIQSGHIELNQRAVDAAGLARDAVRAFETPAANKGIDLRLELMPSLGDVIADPERIALAFANLIGNAIKYTPGGGRVTVSASSHERAVRFTVHDTGPGVPPAHRQAIFERFFRMPGASEPGAGLGLYIAKEIVDAHGGQIGVDGEAGQGSNFWLELHAADG